MSHSNATPRASRSRTPACTFAGAVERRCSATFTNTQQRTHRKQHRGQCLIGLLTSFWRKLHKLPNQPSPYHLVDLTAPPPQSKHSVMYLHDLRYSGRLPKPAHAIVARFSHSLGTHIVRHWHPGIKHCLTGCGTVMLGMFANNALETPTKRTNRRGDSND